MALARKSKWWKEANCYQIWPASFQDSNGDGIGDIPGITSRLDYLKSLGVDLIWLSPIYDSPQHDMGYDVSNYEDVWAKYGTLADMEELIREVKARGMKLIMDLVVNHSSHEHKWFKESAKSNDSSNPYRDWYIWRDPKGVDKDGKPIEPNNWRAAFGGSVWTYVESRRQFYLHLCLPEQPDLNWFNDVTRRAIFGSAIEFWLKKGIDGFRVDVVNFYWKDLSFPDTDITIPGEPYQPMKPEHIINGPLMHPWLQQQRQEALDKYGEDIIMVGELPATGRDEIMRYLDPKYRELDMIFDFDLFMAGNSFTAQLHEMRRAKLTELKPAITKVQGFLKDGEGWPTTFLENHDNSRSIDRFGPGADSKYRVEASRMLALLAITLSGTLFLYQGQEIGMTNVPPTWTQEDFRDKPVLKYLTTIDEQYPGDETMREKALAAALKLGRDNARTPVQWSSSVYAGFSTVEPWIKANPNCAEINVSDQIGKQDGVLEFWRFLLQFRKQHKDTLIYGSFELVDETNEETLAFIKTCSETGTRVLVELNFSDSPQPCHVGGGGAEKTQLLLSSVTPPIGSYGNSLAPWEGRISSLNRSST